ncbi:hypothetical protein [Bacillus sp. FJAT-26390]|jgi:hypothetical protein|uniref:hypothetical protein n=1 Tax=Bacillus sp. FJAT-26390 TaxID=1743142 RepID=UPI000807DE8E|nr:hypothetical protein [Bacillus sp. FJAT-26390]OBZ10043.1 hypothetical protein A7975_21995 [Bacillus sp. FJAT-26390]
MWSPQLKETALQYAANKNSKDKLSTILAEATISMEQKQVLKLSYATPAAALSNGTASSDYWA